MTQYKFPYCDCCFPMEDGKIQFDPRMENIPLDCKLTWDLISNGDTKGIFQLDSNLGRMLSKKLRPENIEHLSALMAIMRPGCLESMHKGKSITNHYIDRKNGEEAVEYFHPALEPILQETYGMLCYQEQSMKIVQQIAGFNLEDADSLRKAIGKKKTDIMAKVKTQFMEGCKTLGRVDNETAEQIFSWIEKSQRYQFNKSHSISYAINGYLSAYAKAHFPKEFFTSYLHYSKEKQKPQEEIKELVNNARTSDIDVFPPDFRQLNGQFKLIDDRICFGLENIKGIGGSVVSSIDSTIEGVEKTLGKKRGEWGWMEFLMFFAPKVNKTAVRALIAAGALSYIDITRRKMLLDYDTYMQLTKNEQAKAQTHYLDNGTRWESLSELNSYILECHDTDNKIASNKNRISKIQGYLSTLNNPPYSLDDTLEWVAGIEKSLMGTSITCAAIDASDVGRATVVCRELVLGTYSDSFVLAATIEEVREIQTKKGKNPGQKMAFVTASDHSGLVESLIAFPNVWDEYSQLIVKDMNLLLYLKKGNQPDSYIINKVESI